MTKMSRHLSRCLRTVPAGLSGSALSAAMSGKLKLHDVCGMTADVLAAFTILLKGRDRSQHLTQRNTSCCVKFTGIQWEYEHNPKDGLYSHNTTLGSKKLVHWVCHKCPQGKLHLYQMTPNDNTNRQEAGSPYCAGRRVCECNSLQSHDTMLCLVWDFARNDITPAQITSRSHQVVGW